MNLNRFEPWGLARAIGSAPAPFAVRRLPLSGDLHNGKEADAAWLPPVDIFEEKTRFVLRADLPGIDPQDIQISAENGTLSLSGERDGQEPEQASGVQRFERRSGPFLRRFSLPESANTDAIAASSRHGTLEITIPKQKPESRRITVEAA